MSESAMRDDDARRRPAKQSSDASSGCSAALSSAAPPMAHACALGLSRSRLRRLRCRRQPALRARRAARRRRRALASAARPAGALFPRFQPLRRQEEPGAAARRLCRLSAADAGATPGIWCFWATASCAPRSSAASPGGSGRRRHPPGFRQYDELPAVLRPRGRLRPRQHHRAVGPRGQRGHGLRPAGDRLRRCGCAPIWSRTASTASPSIPVTSRSSPG